MFFQEVLDVHAPNLMLFHLPLHQKLCDAYGGWNVAQVGDCFHRCADPRNTFALTEIDVIVFKICVVKKVNYDPRHLFYAEILRVWPSFQSRPVTPGSLVGNPLKSIWLPATDKLPLQITACMNRWLPEPPHAV